MKHPVYLTSIADQKSLFADAEFPKDHVQNVLDVDPAEQPPEAMNRDSQLLGDKFVAAPGHRLCLDERCRRIPAISCDAATA